MIWGFFGWQAVIIIVTLIIVGGGLLGGLIYAIKEIFRYQAQKGTSDK